MESRLITLTTDFGTRDPFVGIMKGVIFGINPAARVIDLSHGIPAQEFTGAAAVLRQSAPFFPHGTIHVAVVDPGVGSERRPLLIEAEGSFFVGPDNGILSLAVAEKTVRQIVHISNEIYHLKPVSATFHGRDIFAPVAAYLSLGIPAREFGVTASDYTRIAWPDIIKADRSIEGEIIYIDGFGNLITNVREEDLKEFQRQVTISLGGIRVQGVDHSYTNGAEKDYVALVNSWGLLEISRFRGNAQLESGAKIGDKVHIEKGRGGDRGA